MIASLLTVNSGAANTQPDLDEIRNGLKDEISHSSVGAGYAQMLNFFIEPDISASRLDTDDSRYKVFKLPLQLQRPLPNSDWQLIMRATLSHAEADSEIDLPPPLGPIDSEWVATSGQLGAGLVIPINNRWNTILGAEFGLSRLEHAARYQGQLGQIILPEIADGIIFNWDTNARVGSLVAGLGYANTIREKYELELKSHYSLSHIASYSESRDLPSFSENTGTLSLKADLNHPYGKSIVDLPLFGKLHLGATAFTGANRDALGFTHYFELGYSVGVDISRLGYKVKSLSLGYQWHYGTDVDGYSILFGWELP